MIKPTFVTDVFNSYQGSREDARRTLKGVEDMLESRLRHAGLAYFIMSLCVIIVMSIEFDVAGLGLSMLTCGAIRSLLTKVYAAPESGIRKEYLKCTYEEACEKCRAMGGDPDAPYGRDGEGGQDGKIYPTDGIRSAIAELELQTGKHVRTYPTDFFDAAPTFWEDELSRLSKLAMGYRVATLVLFAVEVASVLVHRSMAA